MANTKARSDAERVQSEMVGRSVIEEGGTWQEACDAIEDAGLPKIGPRQLRLWADEGGWMHVRQLNTKVNNTSHLRALRDARTPGTDAFKRRIEALHGWTPEQRMEAAKEVGEAALELVRQAVILANRVGEVSVQETWDGKVSQMVIVRGADVEAVSKSAAAMFDKADRLGGIPADISNQLGQMAGQLGTAMGFSALDRILTASKDMLGLYDGALPAQAIEAPRPDPLLITIQDSAPPTPEPVPAPPPEPEPEPSKRVDPPAPPAVEYLDDVVGTEVDEL